MAIRLLSIQLANQISAGEVVERPSSVVKELLENSIDAGASQIEIEIEGGGSKLIRIRDNGSGIPKEELSLALARHATSKISSLDDLERLATLGFRGEALASINSVSRLRITSRPVLQPEAWQIYAEGPEMSPTFNPVAHPYGTALEIHDLFYNTPARRKFLRSAKSEFAHIDEMVRRLALAHWGVGLRLSHNGKRVRSYKPVVGDYCSVARVEAVFGPQLSKQLVAVSHSQHFMKIDGWVIQPSVARNQPDLQYCYINGRAVRDKLVSHAVRQALQDKLQAQQYPAFILFLKLDPAHFDVNVHPTKQEVRFHEARTVHDLVHHAVAEALSANYRELEAAGAAFRSVEELEQIATPTAPPTRSAIGELPSVMRSAPSAFVVPREKGRLYHQFLRGGDTFPEGCRSDSPGQPSAVPTKPAQLLVTTSHSLGRLLTVWQRCYALLEKEGLWLLSLPMARRALRCEQLLRQKGAGRSQPLLFPAELPATPLQQEAVRRYQPQLFQLGFEVIFHEVNLTLHTLPPLLRNDELPIWFGKMLAHLAASEEVLDNDALASWLVQQVGGDDDEWQMPQAVQLLSDFEHYCSTLAVSPPPTIVRPVDLGPIAVLLGSGE